MDKYTGAWWSHVLRIKEIYKNWLDENHTLVSSINIPALLRLSLEMDLQCEPFIGPETLSLTSGGRKLSAFDDPHKNISSSHRSPINK